jgi:hypothetical protein
MDDRMIFFFNLNLNTRMLHDAILFPKNCLGCFPMIFKNSTVSSCSHHMITISQILINIVFSSSEVLSSVLEELFNCNYYIYSALQQTLAMCSLHGWPPTHQIKQLLNFLNTNLPRSYNHQVWMNWDLTCI